jgi:PHD/YefM family antitoxin component YafN of YafNO toxin-antitoxin module
MKRIMLAVAAVGMFALVFATGTFAESKSATETGKEVTTSQDKISQNKVAVTITDKKGKEIKLESLSREDQARVARARKAAESLLNEETATGGAARIKIVVTVRCCPPEIIITIRF